MSAGEPEQQLELFTLEGRSVPRVRHERHGYVAWHMRYDQAMLAGIGAVIAITVVFASGVERGKHLVRGERVARVSTEAPAAPNRPVPLIAQPPTAEPTAPNTTKKTATTSGKERRYAIQVVTYTRAQLAQRELQRLHALGERAFLMKRNSHTVVYVGPFPSSDHATQKLSGLKNRYQDCFVKSL